MAGCYNPYQLKELHPHTGELQFVPCGKCPPCRKRIASAWSIRLVEHGKEYPDSQFVTLTYDNAHVPISPARYMTLNKADVQNFMKRLRKRTPLRLSYFAVGEYGGKTLRPHYHLIMYNAQPDDIVKAWMLDGKPLGNVFFGTVQEASIGYCLKYMMKEGKIPMHRNDDRVPEFRLMSKDLASTISPLIKSHGIVQT